jgi:nucleoside-triphosphatase THEP1
VTTIFGRQSEIRAIAEKIRSRKSFLLHGPAGVGKTMLLRHVAVEFPDLLYCSDASTLPSALAYLARELVRKRNSHACERLGKDPDRLQAVSAVNLKGIVSHALTEAGYRIVLDQLGFTSMQFAATIKELVSRSDAQLVAVHRSAHMEDVGFLLNSFPDRSDRLELKNFSRDAAVDFAKEMIARSALRADNLNDFVDRTAELTAGNPGAIAALVRMAREPKYRTGDYIKVTPLYFDYRLFHSEQRNV